MQPNMEFVPCVPLSIPMPGKYVMQLKNHQLQSSPSYSTRYVPNLIPAFGIRCLCTVKVKRRPSYLLNYTLKCTICWIKEFKQLVITAILIRGKFSEFDYFLLIMIRAVGTVAPGGAAHQWDRGWTGPIGAGTSSVEAVAETSVEMCTFACNESIVSLTLTNNVNK